jgi:hypothetical protein
VADDHAGRVVIRVAVDQVWSHLPARQRGVAYLRFVRDYSYAEIAEVLGISPNTVGPTVSAATATMRVAALLVVLPFAAVGAAWGRSWPAQAVASAAWCCWAPSR